MVDCIENFYRDKINMLRERIETEKFERKIAANAQVEALSQMKRELDLGKKKEIQKYLALLKKEDQKYDFQSSNLHKLESEIVRLYKKWADGQINDTGYHRGLRGPTRVD